MSNKILSCYFATKNDPQRGFPQEHNDFDLMRDWYNSLHNNGLSGVIFHDHLYKGFVKHYTTDQLEFVKVEVGSRSLNDDRFYHYRNYLEQHHELDNVLLTDLFDVEFVSDPFQLFNENYSLFSGDETRSISGNPWMEKKLDFMKSYAPFKIPDYFARQTTLSAGIIGGQRNIVIELIYNMLEQFKLVPREFNANMPIYNIVARTMFDEDKIMHGEPLNSKFKLYEEDGNFAIRHK